MSASQGAVVRRNSRRQHRHLSAAQLGDRTQRRGSHRTGRGQGGLVSREADRRRNPRWSAAAGWRSLLSGVLTTCPYCGVGCGLTVAGSVLKGDAAHPANFGRLCSKGAALKETLALPDRLLSPTINGRETDWNEALDTIAARFSKSIRT